jgi:mono/diheme cytochrome c family protein
MPVWIKRATWVAVAVLIVAQAIRPSRTNPPIGTALDISAEAALPPATMAVFRRACNDCHSNLTVWPWYSGVAPISWLVAYDVRAGREKMNLSEWGNYPAEHRAKLAQEMCKEVTEGEMPGPMYTLIHSQAKLTSADVQAVCSWSQTAQK